jgi:sorbitol/mannitol transport system substrate-binding protein
LFDRNSVRDRLIGPDRLPVWCDKGAQSNSGGSIDVAIVTNTQTQDLARLTPSLFTAQSDIRVNYTLLDEGTLREVITRDAAASGRQFDVVMIGPYEAPQFGRDGLIRDLTPMASSDRAYALDDIIPSVRKALSQEGRLYAAPFDGQSSFLMYRKDVLADAGIEMPAHPTWTQVADIARRIDTPERAGICLRGKPGWGELGGTFGTVLNTFGGTWWSAKPDGSVDKAMVDRLSSGKRSSSTSTSSGTRASPAPPPRPTTSASSST